VFASDVIRYLSVVYQSYETARAAVAVNRQRFQYVDLPDGWSTMKRLVWIAGLSSVAIIAIAAIQPQRGESFTKDFGVDTGELVSTGRNPFFSLEPGDRSGFAHGPVQLTITVLAETRVIDGVETRVVEERETNNGALVEVSRNYFAISRRTNSVYYFGEDVDMYKAGKVTSHEGSWISGVRGAHFGLMMPGTPLLHGRYYQELAPRVAMDRGEIVSMSERVTTPAGVYTNTLKIEETTPLEPGQREYKVFARGVGLIQDGDLTLVKTERVTRGRTASAPRAP
jgi:hypothetical protein